MEPIKKFSELHGIGTNGAYYNLKPHSEPEMDCICGFVASGKNWAEVGETFDSHLDLERQKVIAPDGDRRVGVEVSHVERLRQQGFDGSYAIPFKASWKVICTQCEALVINGMACHESGCTNELKARREQEDEDE